MVKRRGRRGKKPVQYSPLVPFFVATVCGILTNHWFHLGASFWKPLLWVSLVAFLATKSVSLSFKNSKVRRGIRFVASTRLYYFETWLLCSALSGIVWIWIGTAALAGLRHEYYYNCFPKNEIGLCLPEGGVGSVVELRVIKTPTLSEYENGARSIYGDDCATHLTGDIVCAKNGGVWRNYSGKVAVSIGGDATELRVGDLVRVVGRLSRPTRPRNPNERDHIFYYRSQRILTTLRANSSDDVQLVEAAGFSRRFWLRRALEKTRLDAASVVRERLSKRNASVAAGMTLGFRNDVDEETHEKFRRTGTVHLLAISGLHVMMVVGAIAFLLRAIGTPPELVAAVTLVFVFLYMGLTDMRPPVIRATVLITIMCLGVLLRRQGFMLNSLACAALVLLALNPCELFQPGAQLSFLATGTFLWSDSTTIFEKAASSTNRWEAIKNRRKEKKERDAGTRLSFIRRTILPLWRRFSRYSWAKARGVTLAGAVVWAVGSPLILSVTNLFTPVAIIANPLIWLPATFSLLLSFLLEFCGLLAGWCGAPWIWERVLSAVAFVTEKSFDLFLGVLDALSASKLGVFHLPTPPSWTLFLFYGFLVSLTVFPRFRPKRRYVALFALIWIGVVLAAWSVNICKERSKDALKVDVFSVGHGCAVLGRFSDGRTFLYDCGSLENSQHAAEIVAKNLWNAGRREIDVVVLSHADFDHYGGMETLLDLVRVRCVCVSHAMFEKENESTLSLRKKLEDLKVKIELVSAGQNLSFLGFPELTTLHPTSDSEETFGETNANSVVLTVDYLGRSFLLPGDLDSDSVSFLDGPPKKCDFVLAPHHGGRSSNAEALFEWSDPDYVGISGGSFLRNYAMEDALRAQGRRVAHTFDDGDVQITIERDPIVPNGRGRFRATTFKSERSSTTGTF